MNVTSPPGVANPPMYPFRYNRSRHSTSNVTCPSNSSGMFAIPRFYGIPQLFARRFEVEDLARSRDSPLWALGSLYRRLCTIEEHRVSQPNPSASKTIDKHRCV